MIQNILTDDCSKSFQFKVSEKIENFHKEIEKHIKFIILLVKSQYYIIKRLLRIKKFEVFSYEEPSGEMVRISFIYKSINYNGFHFRSLIGSVKVNVTKEAKVL